MKEFSRSGAVKSAVTVTFVGSAFASVSPVFQLV